MSRSLEARLARAERALSPATGVHVVQIPAGLSEAQADAWQQARGQDYPARDTVVFIRLFGADMPEGPTL